LLENLLDEIANEQEQIHHRAHKVHGPSWPTGQGEKQNIDSVVSVVKIPILVKLAPDLTDDELEAAVGVILDCGMDGIIATNTTLSRDGLRSAQRQESGGVSGSPLKVRSKALLEKIVRLVDGQIPIVSVGGIMSPEDAKRRLDMGATLVQVYTGLIYRGPGLVREIVNAL
jgi:dihydroorotate dehydrogenase